MGKILHLPGHQETLPVGREGLCFGTQGTGREPPRHAVGHLHEVQGGDVPVVRHAIQQPAKALDAAFDILGFFGCREDDRLTGR